MVLLLKSEFNFTKIFVKLISWKFSWNWFQGNFHEIDFTKKNVFPQFRAVAAQIILTTRRVNTAGSINATHTEASKAEEDFRKLQEQKKAQDLYLNKLIKDQEDLDQKALDYQAQADAMLQQSEEIMNIVS